MITVGNTFLVPSGPGGNHLFFVVIGPINIEGEPPGQFLLVNATSNSNDTACIIQPNDHPFIKHESYIAYRYARMETAADLQRKIGSLFIQRENCSPELLKKIIEGAKKSKYLRRDIKAILFEL